MTYGPYGVGGGCPECKKLKASKKRLISERDRLAAENAELKATDHYQRSLDEMHLRYNVEAELATANATLDRVREVVPEKYDIRRFCPDCKHLVHTCGHPDYNGEYCIECDEEVWHLNGDDQAFHDVLAAILYPAPETTDATK